MAKYDLLKTDCDLLDSFMNSAENVYISNTQFETPPGRK